MDKCQFEVRVSPKMRLAHNNIGPYRQRQEAYTFSVTSISLLSHDKSSADSNYNKLWAGSVETLRNILMQGAQDFQARSSTSYDLKKYPAGQNELLFMYVFQRYIHTWPRELSERPPTIYSFVDHLIGQVIQYHHAWKSGNNSNSSKIQELPTIETLPTITEEAEEENDDTDIDSDYFEEAMTISTPPSEQEMPPPSPPTWPKLRRAFRIITSARPELRETQESDKSSSFFEEEPYGTLVEHPLYSHGKEKWKAPVAHGKNIIDLESNSYDDSDKENIPPGPQNKGKINIECNGQQILQDKEPPENDRLKIFKSYRLQSGLPSILRSQPSAEGLPKDLWKFAFYGKLQV